MKRYSIRMKRTDVVRCECDTLQEVAMQCFGFSMSNTFVYVFDNIENRIVEHSEFKKETENVIDYHNLRRLM